MSLVSGQFSAGQRVPWRDWHTLAYSFARHGVTFEQYGALRATVTRVLDAREASGLGREHPLVRRHGADGSEYLWGDDWRAARKVTADSHQVFGWVAARFN